MIRTTNYYPKPLPYRTDDYTKFTAQNAYQEQQIQRKVDEAKAEQHCLEGQKEEEKRKQKAYLDAAD